MRNPLLAAVAVLLSLVAGAARAQNALLELVTDQASSPVYVADPGDGRLFIVELTGRVRIFANGSLQPSATPFLDLHNDVNTDGEGGLLSIAFDPGYASNRLVYAMYTRSSTTGSGAILQTVIARYTAQMADPNHVDPASVKIVLALDAPPGADFTNHKGGTLQFGPDGLLYAAFGDGGSQDDPGCRSQTHNLLYGKMIRINPDGDDFPADANRNYAIPTGNPFANDPNYLPEIWSLGFRNPFRFSFDRMTGDLWVGDVGGSLREEIDMDASPSRGRGENFGWKIWEGTHCHVPDESVATCLPLSYVQLCTSDQSPMTPAYTPPLVDFVHGGGDTMIGGYVYRGGAAGWRGRYIFADFGRSDIFALTHDAGVWGRTVLSDNDVQGPVGFGEDHNGELYVTSLFTGKVFRLRFDRIDGHITKQQANCVRKLNEGFVTLANMMSLQIRSCETRATNGTLARSYPSIDACIDADPMNRLDKVRTRNAATDTALCSALTPDVGYAGAGAGNAAAVATDLDLAHDVFGADLSAGIVPRATDRKTAACQTAVASALALCQQTRRAEFLRCKKAGLLADSLRSSSDLAACLGDPKGRIARACDAASGRVAAVAIARSCVAKGVDLSTAFPGCNLDDPAALAQCLDRAGQCRNCELFDAADALGAGVCDSSCQ